jgi:hypothetical protein
MRIEPTASLTHCYFFFEHVSMDEMFRCSGSVNSVIEGCACLFGCDDVRCTGFNTGVQVCAANHGCPQGTGQTMYLHSLEFLIVEIIIGEKNKIYQILLTKVITVLEKEIIVLS